MVDVQALDEMTPTRLRRMFAVDFAIDVVGAFLAVGDGTAHPGELAPTTT